MKPQISLSKIVQAKSKLKTNTMNVTYDDDCEIVGPGAYNHPGFWNKPSLVSHYRNNPSFTFGKSLHLDRSLSIPKFMLPGVGKYNVNALLLKKSMPKITIGKSLRFKKHCESLGESIFNIPRPKSKIQGVFY